MNMMLWYPLVGMQEALQIAEMARQQDTQPYYCSAVSGRMWYVDDSPHLTCESPQGTGKAGENGQPSRRVSKDGRGKDRRFGNRLRAARVAIDWVTGRSCTPAWYATVSWTEAPKTMAAP